MIKKLNPKLIKLFELLKDAQYHDGTALGNTLKITRAAVWKTIKKLQESYDIKIDSLKGKGYLMKEPIALLDQNKIKAYLSAHVPEHWPKEKIELCIFESINSTNQYFKNRDGNKKNENTISMCLSETQTEGRGRLQRDWHSPFGRNIYFSCLYPFKKDVSELAGLSLVTSLAVANTLKQFELGNKLWVKWPNDIIYDHKKLAGSLIEIQAEAHDRCQAIIGIGINVNMINADDSISQPWTSLKQILGQDIDRNILTAQLILNLLQYLQQFVTHGFNLFLGEWEKMDGLSEQKITLKNLNEKVTGKAMGVNDQGHLLLKLQNGEIKGFSAGETTILKRE